MAWSQAVKGRDGSRRPAAGSRKAPTAASLRHATGSDGHSRHVLNAEAVPLSGYRLPVTGYRLLGLPATGYRFQVGFSLIEMVAVMVLIALVFAMVSMSFSRSLASARVQAASRDLVAALRYTRGQAIVRGKSTTLELDVENNRYMVPGPRVVDLPKNMHMALTTADIEQTAQNSGRIRFFPDGASTGGHISVFMGNDEWRINVDWLTGAVTREELKR
jgi:general secretion pathway protein H